MKAIDIFYFSGTGNSLAVARDVARETNARLIPVASVINQESITVDAGAFGIVFPVFYETYGGIPPIIDRFVRKLEDLGSKYIFAICTYGGGSIVTLKHLGKAIQAVGGRLAAGFTVNMPENVASSRYNYPELQQRMFDTWRQSVGGVRQFINARQEGRFDTPNVMVGRWWVLAKIIGLPALWLAKRGTLKALQEGSSSSLLSYTELLPLMDKSFRTGERCDGCGICAKICPVTNIQIVDHRPQWQHHCELCLACFHWCPKQAIISTAFPTTVRYHHPDITLLDMVRKWETGIAK